MIASSHQANLLHASHFQNSQRTFTKTSDPVLCSLTYHHIHIYPSTSIHIHHRTHALISSPLQKKSSSPSYPHYPSHPKLIQNALIFARKTVHRYKRVPNATTKDAGLVVCMCMISKAKKKKKKKEASAVENQNKRGRCNAMTTPSQKNEQKIKRTGNDERQTIRDLGRMRSEQHLQPRRLLLLAFLLHRLTLRHGRRCDRLRTRLRHLTRLRRLLTMRRLLAIR